MKKIVLAFFLIFILGCYNQRQLTVNEITKQRTHKFNYQYDGEKMMLTGDLNIDKSLYSTVMLFTQNSAKLIRENQCIKFDSPKILFGFIPPFWSENFEVNITDLGNLDVPIKYEITDTDRNQISLVEFNSLLEYFDQEQFDEYNQMDCITEGEYVNNVR